MKKCICLFFAALSFLYYLWLGLHNGFHMSALPFWLLLSLFLSALAFLFPKLPIRLQFILRLCLSAGLLFFLLVESCILWGMTRSGQENLAYIIVPGAGLNGTTPSPVLAKRLESALAYLQAHPDTKVIVSGGQGADEIISEAESMERWMLRMGIDGSRILVEDQSTTTAENMRYSLSLISDDRSRPENASDAENLNIGIATSNFHVFRSLCIAARAKEEADNDAQEYRIYGIAADFSPLLLPHYMVREFFTICVDAGLGNMNFRL